MKLFQALKRACSFARKGESIAILPPSGGLASRVAVRKPGMWVCWVLDEDIPTPGVLVEVADLSLAVKPKVFTVDIARTMTIPTHLHIQDAVVKCAPLMNYSDWFPPFPLDRLDPVWTAPEPFLALVHNTVEDRIRPELSGLYTGPEATYAGNEAQLAYVPVGLVSHDRPYTLIPSNIWMKWPVNAPFRYWIGPKALYLQTGEEFRVATLPESQWWPHEAGKMTMVMSSEWITLTVKDLVASYKEAKRIADRRLVAIGTTFTGAWMRVGEHCTGLKPTHEGKWSVWQTVLDGNLFLESLKSLDSKEVDVGFNASNPRAPVFLSYPGYTEAIFPLISTEKHS